MTTCPRSTTTTCGAASRAPTSRFGEDVAILGGDALLAEAFRLALRVSDPAVARELAAATLGMIGGQYVDITTNGELDGDGLAALHRLKTGKLLGACVGCALEVAGVPAAEQEPWRAFGDEIGLLFQIVDDILDATGTAEELGKTPGKDEAAGKVTYVSLHGLDRAREIADETRRRVDEHAGRASSRHVGARRARRDHPRPAGLDSCSVTGCFVGRSSPSRGARSAAARAGCLRKAEGAVRRRVWVVAASAVITEQPSSTRERRAALGGRAGGASRGSGSPSRR